VGELLRHQVLGTILKIQGWVVALASFPIRGSGVHVNTFFETISQALYFSITTYTTIGYGDVVLPVGWRLLGAIEGVTGVLTFGWSTGVIFAVASRLLTMRIEQKRL
jgi:hypothetical protein